MKKLMFLSLLSLSTGVSAYIHSNPEDIGFFGEWLYFQPKVDNSYFAIDDKTQAIGQEGTRIKNEPHYHSGFRVGGYFGFNCGGTDLVVRYTQLTTDYSKTLIVPNPSLLAGGEALFAAVGNPAVLATVPGTSGGPSVAFGFASACSHFNYYAGDAFVSHSLFDWSALTMNTQLGAHYASLSNHNHYDFATAVGGHFLVTEKTWYWGVGPQIGVDLNWYLGCDFAIVAKATGALLIGRNHSSTESASPQATTPVSVEQTNDNDWRFVPAQNYRIGLNYHLNPCGWCVRFNIEAGYELVTYFRAFDTIVERNDFNAGLGDLRSFDTFSNVGMNGPYVNLTINF